MLPYCLKFRKMKESKIQKLQEKKLEEECFYQNVQCVIVKYQKFKQHEARGLLSSLGIKTPLIEIPLVGPLLF